MRCRPSTRSRGTASSRSTRAAATGRPLWRLIAPPVDDALFGPPREPAHRSKIAVTAPSTPYRERLLLGAKHAHDLRARRPRLTPGSTSDVDVAVVLRPHATRRLPARRRRAMPPPGTSSSPTTPPTASSPASTSSLADDAAALTAAVGAVRAAPAVHHRVRVRGRLKAERFRASTVWPQLVADLQADLAAFDN